MFCEIMMKKIAIPTREDMVDDHFGHCAYYTVVTLDDENQVQNSERLDSPEGCGCKSNIASVMQEMGITLMLAGNMGMGAYNKLSAHGERIVYNKKAADIPQKGMSAVDEERDYNLPDCTSARQSAQPRSMAK